MTTEMSKLKDDHLKETKRLRKEKKDWETQRKLAEILPTKRFVTFMLFIMVESERN
jgi:hypothetical protein